jgi:nitrogen fixation NifU-like protein
MYSPQLIDHFQHPRNVGELSNADANARVENPACGDIMTLHLRVAGERIAEARYRVKGCVAAIGCGSALTELVIGQTLADVRALTREGIVAEVGGLPPASEHASHLAIDCLHAALHSLVQK